MVDEMDAMKQTRDAAVKELEETKVETDRLRECLEGGFFCNCVLNIHPLTAVLRPLRHHY